MKVSDTSYRVYLQSELHWLRGLSLSGVTLATGSNLKLNYTGYGV